MTDLITRAVIGTKYQQRRDDLISEGYNILFEHTDFVGVFTKMRHRNGNIVIITCDYDKRTITQKTNGRIVHTEKVCES
ncbi:MAG: hypothetical protein J6S05_08060 [Bacteroidaceae bacterium]|nr:hypothetical protein [Bacteroidaceae bacterium]